jgi:riboflavin synthase
VPKNITINPISCENYTLNGKTYTTSGIYLQKIVTKSGCDSTVTLNLTINKNKATNITQTGYESYVLNGQTYTTSGIYSQKLITKSGCDSIITLNLTINKNKTNSISKTSCDSYTLNGQTYSLSGTYTQKLIAKGGCDSTVTLNLTINKNKTSSISKTSCDSYTLNGQTYSSSGIYTQKLVAKSGCDSILTLNLTVNKIDVSVTTVGNSLSANSSGMIYQWLDCNKNKTAIVGATQQNYKPLNNGSYAVSITKDACSAVSTCYAINTIATLEQQLLSKVMIYPNPSEGKYIVTLPQAVENIQINIIDAIGRTIYSQYLEQNQQFSIDLTDNVNGIYFLHLSINEEKYTYKLIKE